MFNQKVVLAKRPDDSFPEKIDCFKYIKDGPIPDPKSLKPNELLLKIIYISIEPVTRVWISGARSYINPTNISDPIPSFGIAQVVASRDHKFKQSDIVFGMFAWENYHICNTSLAFKIPEEIASGNLIKFLSLFGPTGITAYLGLQEAGKPKENDVLVVSAAAGSCGSIVIQLGKRWGCKVIGIAGNDEKCEFVKKIGADDCINYKKTDKINTLSKKLRESIRKINGKGVDIFFDNVGEESLDAVLENLNENARIIMCGAMATYGNWKNYNGIKNIANVITKRAVMEGILYFGQTEKMKGALLGLWIMNQEKEIVSVEEVVQGIENVGKALQRVYYGENKGKYIIAVGEKDLNLSKL